MVTETQLQGPRHIWDSFLSWIEEIQGWGDDYIATKDQVFSFLLSLIQSCHPQDHLTAQEGCCNPSTFAFRVIDKKKQRPKGLFLLLCLLKEASHRHHPPNSAYNSLVQKSVTQSQPAAQESGEYGLWQVLYLNNIRALILWKKERMDIG